MYAMLGLITIDALKNGMMTTDHTYSAAFAEHAVFKGKPQLQRLTANLETLSFSFNLSYKTGSVSGRISSLKNMLEKQNPVTLIMGNGRYVGMFVLNDVAVTTTISDDRGGFLGADINVSLTEWAGKIEAVAPKSAIANKALGAIGAAKNAITGAIDKVTGAIGGAITNVVGSSAFTAISGAVSTVTGAINGAKGIIDQASNIGNTIKQLGDASDPIQMLKGIAGAVTQTLDVAVGIKNLELPNGAAFTGFLSSVGSASGALSVIKDIGGDAIAANILGEQRLSMLKAAGNNLQSASSFLSKDIPKIAAEIGKRTV